MFHGFASAAGAAVSETNFFFAFLLFDLREELAKVYVSIPGCGSRCKLFVRDGAFVMLVIQEVREAAADERGDFRKGLHRWRPHFVAAFEFRDDGPRDPSFPGKLCLRKMPAHTKRHDVCAGRA
jgi:hypothetical protein